MSSSTDAAPVVRPLLQAEADGVIARIAVGQHGRVSRGQLLEAGLRSDAIDRRIARGVLIREFPGVYAVGYVGPSDRAALMAAALWCGPDALVGLRSAAALNDIREDRRGVVDVIAPRSRHRRLDVLVYRARTVTPEERTEVDGVPCTSVARTLADLAGVLTFADLRKTWREAVAKDLLDLDAIAAQLARGRGRRGIAALRHLHTSETGLTRSGREVDLLAFCDHHGVPRPVTNAEVRVGDWTYEVDGLWADARVVVEADSWKFHKARDAFEDDRRRDTRLQAAGYRVVRLTSRRLREQPTRSRGTCSRCSSGLLKRLPGEAGAGAAAVHARSAGPPARVLVDAPSGAATRQPLRTGVDRVSKGACDGKAAADPADRAVMVLLVGGVLALWTAASMVVLGLTTAAARGDRADRARIEEARTAAAATRCGAQGRLGTPGSRLRVGLATGRTCATGGRRRRLSRPGGLARRDTRGRARRHRSI